MGRFNGRASYEQVWELAMVLLNKREAYCDTLADALRAAVREIEKALDEDGGFTDHDLPDEDNPSGVTYNVSRGDGLVVERDVFDEEGGRTDPDEV